MELVANAPQLVVQLSLGAAAVTNPWIPLVITGAQIMTTLIFAYTNEQARKEDVEKREREEKWREKQYSEQKKVLKEENDGMRLEFQERQREIQKIYEKMLLEDKKRRVLKEQRQDATFAEQRRQLKEELTEIHTRSGNEEIRFEKIIEEFQSKGLNEIGEKLEADQKKRTEEEERRNKLFDEIKRLATEKQNSLVTENYDYQRRMEKYNMEQQTHLAMVIKTPDVMRKVIELGDLIGFYEDFGQRYGSDHQKMVSETERYQRDLGIQLKRVSNALVEGEADVHLLNIWLNGAAHHIQILQRLGVEGLESLESVRAAVKIHWDTWKRLVTGFNNSLSSTDNHVLEVERYFEETYYSQVLLVGTLSPLIGGRMKNEL